MKARLENNEIKVYSSIPNSFQAGDILVAGGGKNLSEETLKSYGFLDVITPDYDKETQELSAIYLSGEVYTYDVKDKKFTLPLDTYKERKIAELKLKAYNDLLKTDWAIVRKAETGQEIPTNISEERAIIRNTTNDKEAEINALTTKKDVVSYKI